MIKKQLQDLDMRKILAIETYLADPSDNIASELYRQARDPAVQMSVMQLGTAQRPLLEVYISGMVMNIPVTPQALSIPDVKHSLSNDREAFDFITRRQKRER